MRFADFLLAAVVLLVVALALAPVESMRWWSRQGVRERHHLASKLRPASVGAASHATPTSSSVTAERTPPTASPDPYVVYLSGIGAIDGDTIPETEEPFLEALRHRYGERLVADVFPYSVQNRGMSAQRPFAWLWRAVLAVRKRKPEAALPYLVNLRNAMQVLVCADQRYAPVFNLGTAGQVVDALERAGYQFDGTPVIIIGWSGGAQIALGAAQYLTAATIPVDVISIGGVMASDAGLAGVGHLCHLYGSKDWLQRVGAILSPGRWRVWRSSYWNRARRAGKITLRIIGPMRHAFGASYFDAEATAEDGRRFLQVTTDEVLAALAELAAKR